MVAAFCRARTAGRSIAPRQDLPARRQGPSARSRSGGNVAAAGCQEQFGILSIRAESRRRANECRGNCQEQSANSSMETKGRNISCFQAEFPTGEELIVRA